VNWLLVRLGPRRRAVRGVARNRALRRAQLSFVCFNVAEAASWIAVLVYAYDRGGTPETGTVALLLLVPAGIAAPIAGSLGDRFRRHKVVAWGYAAQALTSAAVAAAMLTHRHPGVVYAAAALQAIVLTTGRPGHHSLLPWLARSPDELTAGNAVSSLVEGLGGTAGTVLVTFSLAVASVGHVYTGVAVVASTAATVAFTLHPEHHPPRTEGAFHPWTLATEAIEGLVSMARSPGVRLLLGIAAATTLVWGVFDVLVVELAIDVLGIGDSGVGALHTAMGVGVLVGAGGSVALVGRKKLTPGLLLGALLMGGSIAMAGVTDGVAMVAVACAVAGGAVTLLDVVGRTLLQRVVDDRLLTRVFSAVEALWMIGIGVGAAVAAALSGLVGLTATLVAAGLVVPVLTIATTRALRRLDREAVVPETQLTLLRGTAIFAPLPFPDLERTARQMDRIEVPAGRDVVVQGESGDRFYLIESGTFEVIADGRMVNDQGPGDHFGEIALLHDVARTATVRATTDGVVWTLDQEEFLATVTGLPQAEAAARQVSAERLRSFGS
jgi:MFS family permease